MTDLEGCIRFWENKLLHDYFILEPSVITQVELTIKFLKKLQKLEQEKGVIQNAEVHILPEGDTK